MRRATREWAKAWGRLFVMLAIVGVVACGFGTCVYAQSLPLLPRTTSTTGLNDSALTLISDSAQRTRAATLAEYRKALSVRAFDSLITANLNLSGATVTGSPTLTGALLAADGSAASASYGFSGAANTGMYRDVSGNVAIAKLGNVSALFNVNGIRPGTDGIQYGNAGSATAPLLRWAVSGSPDTVGLYRAGPDTLGIATAGAVSVRITGGTSPVILGSAGGLSLVAGSGNNRQVSIRGTTNTGGLGALVVVDSANISWGAGKWNTSQMKAPDGSAAVPGLSFLGNQSGFYNVGGSSGIGVSVNGGQVMQFLSNGLEVLSPVFAANGAVNAPSYAFDNKTTTGYWRPSGGDSVALSLSGVRGPTWTGGAAVTLLGGAGDFTALAGVGNSRSFIFRSSNSSGAATTFATGSGDTVKFGGHAIATAFTTATGTPGTICYNTTTSELTKNAALTCTVSARRFKHDIAPLSSESARKIVDGLKPQTFTYNAGNRRSLGFVAEEVDSVDTRLTFRNSDGQLNSVDYQAVVPALVRVVQDQQKELRWVRFSAIMVLSWAVVVLFRPFSRFVNRSY